MTNNQRSLSEQEWSYNSFIPIYSNGFIQNQINDLSVEFKYNYINQNYNYKLGVICNNSGVYCLGAGFTHKNPDSSFGANEQDLTTECDKEMIHEIRFPVNRLSDGTHQNNYHIFNQNMNIGLETLPDEIKYRTFTFKVN